MQTLRDGNVIIALNREYPSRYGLPVIAAVDTQIFTTLFPISGCGPECRDACCRGGAIMDIRAYDALRGHRQADIFRAIEWDVYAFQDDPYSPGGKGCYTRFDNGRCMFQNPDWGCSIHSYCLRQGIDVRELKFFTCCLFPVEVNKVGDTHHVLTAGYEMRFPEFDIPCKKNGDTPVCEIARQDILYYYGENLIRILDDLGKKTRA